MKFLAIGDQGWKIERRFDLTAFQKHFKIQLGNFGESRFETKFNFIMSMDKIVLQNILLWNAQI